MRDLAVDILCEFAVDTSTILSSDPHRFIPVFGKRAFSAERSFVRGYTDPLFLCLIGLRPYYLITSGSYTLLLSLATPKLSELVKSYDYRIFYIGFLGFTQLFRRLDIKQRLQAGFDRFSTFGEPVPNIAAKAKRSMKGYQNPAPRRLVVNIPADVQKYSNMSSAEDNIDPEKLMVGRLFSFWEGLFSGSMLNIRSVTFEGRSG